MAIKYGFHEHHTEECDLELMYTNKGGFSLPPYRAYFCHTHNQWCYERPVKVTYTFENNNRITTKRS